MTEKDSRPNNGETPENDVNQSKGSVVKFKENAVPATQTGPETNKCDLEYCNGCGQSGDPANMGYYIDGIDVGKNAKGGTAEVFRLDVEEQLGKIWLGFEQDDIGYWCENCSWTIQRERSRDQKQLQTQTDQSDVYQ